jgi:hypothetical protein
LFVTCQVLLGEETNHSEDAKSRTERGKQEFLQPSENGKEHFNIDHYDTELASEVQVRSRKGGRGEGERTYIFSLKFTMAL